MPASFQDRYILIEDCKELADYYEDLVDNISQFSFVVNRDGQFVEGSSSFKGVGFSKFVQKSSSILKTFVKTQQEKNRIDSSASVDTVIFPTVQMGLYGITEDCDVTSSILRAGEEGSSYHFATGYFNLTERFMRDIMETRSRYSLLMAHPEANGFLGARFPIGGIPHAYTDIARTFRGRLLASGMAGRARLFEYRRPGWTFHGKGLWVTEAGRSDPSLTMVGSPNFGYRSEKRDLESQLVIVTENEDLQQRLGEEQRRLYSHSEAVEDKTLETEDRRTPTWVKFVVKVAREWF